MFTVDDYAETFARLAYPDKLITLTIPELVDELGGLGGRADEQVDPDFPLVLSAGERRSGTANTIFRDPAWRKQDRGRRAAGAPRRRGAARHQPTAGARG